jgi:hypothetical protein
MAIIYDKPIDEIAWLIKWSSNAATPVTFRVYSEGRLLTPNGLVSSNGRGHWTLVVMPGEYPFFEVLDKACSIPSIAFSGHLDLQWYGTGNKQYRVEKYNGASRDIQETITDDGRGYFTWGSEWLADVTTHTYRIVPVSTASNDGTALSLICPMVRHPDSPSVAVTYNGAGPKTIHVAAA